MNKNLKTLLLVSVLLVSVFALSACTNQDDLKGDLLNNTKTTKEVTTTEKIKGKEEVIEEKADTMLKEVTENNMTEYEKYADNEIQEYIKENDIDLSKYSVIRSSTKGELVPGEVYSVLNENVIIGENSFQIQDENGSLIKAAECDTVLHLIPGSNPPAYGKYHVVSVTSIPLKKD